MRLILISLLLLLCRAYSIQWVAKIMDGEDVTDTQIRNNHLFTLSPKLKIHTIENPHAPKLVGVLDTNITFDRMQVDDKYAYLIEDRRNFYVADIQNLSTPKLIGHYGLDGGSFRNLTVKDGYAYIAAIDSGLLIIDIRAPTTPSLVNKYKAPNTYPVTEVLGFDHYLILATNSNLGTSSFLLILDISSPTSPAIVGTPNSTGANQLRGLSIKHPYLYAVRSESGLSTFNLSDLEQISSSSTNDNFITTAERTYTSEDLVFATGGLLGIQVFREAPISSPSPISSFYPSGGALSMAIKDKTIYAGSTAGMHVLDASTLTNKPPIINDSSRVAITQIIPVDTFLYVLSETGLNSFSNSDEANPQSLHLFLYGDRAMDMVMENDTAYIADTEDGLNIFSAWQPRRLFFVGKYREPGGYRRIAKKGDFLYMGRGSTGIDIIEKSRPDEPAFVKHLSEHALGELFVDGNILYVCRGDSGLAVYDISSPENPNRISTTPIPGTVMGIEVRGGFAYVPTMHYGVTVLDVSNPAAPVILSSYDTPGYSQDLLVQVNRLYVADMGSRIPVYDISDPKTLKFLGTLYTPGRSYRLAAGKKMLYSMNKNVGFSVLDKSDITPVIPKPQTRFHRNPGRFSYEQSSRAITFRFDAHPVWQVSIFDIHGKLLTRLTPASPEAATSIRWDKRTQTGAAVPRGIYFIKAHIKSHPHSFPFIIY